MGTSYSPVQTDIFAVRHVRYNHRTVLKKLGNVGEFAGSEETFPTHMPSPPRNPQAKDYVKKVYNIE